MPCLFLEFLCVCTGSNSLEKNHRTILLEPCQILCKKNSPFLSPTKTSSIWPCASNEFMSVCEALLLRGRSEDDSSHKQKAKGLTTEIKFVAKGSINYNFRLRMYMYVGEKTLANCPN